MEFTKKENNDWEMFFDPKTNRKMYNAICCRCNRECKQAYRVTIVCCNKFIDKRVLNTPASLSTSAVSD